MVEDWIKMRTDLYRDPKVCAMADHLMSPDGDLARYVSHNASRDMTVTRNVMRNVTVGALVSVWGVMRKQGTRIGDDILCAGVTLAVIDDIADLPGFGEAMASVGWAIEDENGITFPRFFESNNADPSESPNQKAAARQRKYREKLKAESDVTRDEKRDVTRDAEVTQSDALEKRREESKHSTPNGVLPGIDSGATVCPHQQIIELYHELLPAGTHVRVWNGARQKHLQARWREDARRQDLGWWRKFFEYAAKSDFLTGRAPAAPGRDPFVLGLDWLVAPQNFAKVIEGKYHRSAA